jgi:Ca2+/Na+ antiporter
VLILTSIIIKLVRDLGWQVYKRLGANIQHRRMYVVHQILLTLLKLNVFFFIALAAQLLTLVIMDGETFPWTIMFILIPACLMSAVLAYLSLQREHVLGMAIFVVSCVAAMGYLIFKLVRVVQTVDADPDPYKYSRTVLLTFIGINLALQILTCIYAIRCMRNFGHGLLAARRKFKQERQEEEVEEEKTSLAESVSKLESAHLKGPNRFELD